MIETERLLIRPLGAEDRERMLEFWLDPVNERGEMPPAHVERWAAAAWGVWERDWELAYAFRRDRWGRGYASEAALACVRHGFEVMGLKRIVADVDPANLASVRVLDKCGFEHVGGEPPKLLYAITRETFR